MKNYDVIVIGSGIGGLCCGSLLALQGKRILICEAHSKPGGVAHTFSNKNYKFESGPSLWSGLSIEHTNNPLGQILNLLDEKLNIKKYKSWRVLFPEAKFDLEVGDSSFRQKVKELRGESSLEEWDSFMASIKPLSEIISKIPLLSSSPRNLNFVETLTIAKEILPNIKSALYFKKPFGDIADDHLQDPFLKNWINLLSFLISGMSMYDTSTPAMATLFEEWFKQGSFLEYPIGGSESIVNALVKGLTKNGGELLLSRRVKKINFQNNLATGVTLENGSQISSDHVVINCDLWSIEKIVPNYLLNKWKIKSKKINKCDSFLHIHLGFDATNLDNLPIHTIWVDSWKREITADRNIAVFSIPTVLDPSMAPKGKHVLHGYTPANEPWEIWKNLDSNSEDYKKLKEERCSIFFKALKEIIPDIEKRIEIKMLGTPLTHQKFTNTYCGSYGPAISAAKNLFPGCNTPIKNLFVCGGSAFPGIGIPAVSASGAYAAEAILGKREYKKLINK